MHIMTTKKHNSELLLIPESCVTEIHELFHYREIFEVS